MNKKLAKQQIDILIEVLANLKENLNDETLFNNANHLYWNIQELLEKIQKGDDND